MIYSPLRVPRLSPSLTTAALWLVSLTVAVTAVLVPEEVIDLSSKNSPNAAISTVGGSFKSGGWVPQKKEDHLVANLKKPIGKNEWAAVELEVTNFDLKHLLASRKCDFFALFNNANGSPSDRSKGNFITARCKGEMRTNVGGYSKKIDGENAQGLRFVFRTSQSGPKRESMGSAGNSAGWSGSKVYRFTFEFQQHRVLFYRNDTLVWGHAHYVRSSALSHVYAGGTKKHNADWGSFPGAVFRKMTVYRDDGTPPPADPLFAKSNHIKINVGGYDDMVPGWRSAVPYASKGQEFQWFKASFTTDGTKNAAPFEVYKTLIHKNHNYDSKEIYQDSVEMAFPLRDGKWTVRLHWIDGEDPTRVMRAMDVDVNGKRVISDLDVRKKAGRSVAWTTDIPVTITGGKGLTISIYDDNNTPSLDYFLNGVEMIATDAPPAPGPGPTPEPTGLLMPRKWQSNTLLQGTHRPAILINAAGRSLPGTIDGPSNTLNGYVSGIQRKDRSGTPEIVIQP